MYYYKMLTLNIHVLFLIIFYQYIFPFSKRKIMLKNIVEKIFIKVHLYILVILLKIKVLIVSIQALHSMEQLHYGNTMEAKHKRKFKMSGVEN